jgi:hypothetical protein
VNPLARVVQMSIQTQEIKETMDVPSKEGMSINIEMSVLYHLDPEKAADVYRTVGEDFVGVILEPQFRSITRGVTASYEAKALYTSEREAVAKLISDDLKKLVESRGIAIESTPMRRLTLPAKITSAIEDKLSADQESQRMTFVLTKEKQEADRKRIEAQGIADFQKIVTEGNQRQAAAVEGYRGHAGPRQEPEREDCHHRQSEERPAVGARRREVTPAAPGGRFGLKISACENFSWRCGSPARLASFTLKTGRTGAGRPRRESRRRPACRRAGATARALPGNPQSAASARRRPSCGATACS